MSFAGDLEHLPLVDVIQLLQQTKKTGTLRLGCPKGECQLGFRDGYIVSAGHLNNVPRIGEVLVDMKVLSPDALGQTLAEQKSDGRGRPLIALLVESGRVSKDDALRGLESLIQMTIVEALTWLKGTFELDVGNVTLSDDYRYFPETLNKDFFVSTQNVLMDALRIYDEGKRDGTITDQDFAGVIDGGEAGTETGDEPRDGGFDISADILGLDDLDKIDKPLPRAFRGAKAVDPLAAHRSKVQDEIGDQSDDARERYVTFLAGLSDMASFSAPLALIAYTGDELLSYTFSVASKYAGFFVFTTDDAANLDLIIEQSVSKELTPVLVVDAPASGNRTAVTDLTAIWRKRSSCPNLSVIQLTTCDDMPFLLAALREGVTAFPKPDKAAAGDRYADESIQCLGALFAHLRNGFNNAARDRSREFSKAMIEIERGQKASDVTLALLSYASGMFPRVITLAVTKTELVAERSVGIRSERSSGATLPLKFKIPLADRSVFLDVVTKCEPFYGHLSDEPTLAALFAEIGAPDIRKGLIQPVRSLGKVVALVYADFGSGPAVHAQFDLLDLLSRHAGLMLDSILYRKMFEKSQQTA